VLINRVHLLFIMCVSLIGICAATTRAQSTAEEFIKRGRELIEQKQYYEASKNFDAAVKLDPNSAEANYYRGMYHLDRKQGIADLTKAIALKSDYAEAYYQRGLHYDLAGDSAAALQDYNKAIELQPRFLEAYRTRAVIYLLAGKGAEAIADYTRIIELRPDGESYYMRGNSYLEIGQSAKAIVDLTQSIKLDPTYYWSYKQRAKAYRHLMRLKLAEADERKAAQIGPPK
jgi:tetratricopeptide (TPR) repeat protein